MRSSLLLVAAALAAAAGLWLLLDGGSGVGVDGGDGREEAEAAGEEALRGEEAEAEEALRLFGVGPRTAPPPAAGGAGGAAVGAGSDAPSAAPTLARGHVDLRAVVLGPDGRPLEGVRVIATGETTWQAVTDAEGRIAGCHPLGRYDLLLLLPGRGGLFVEGFLLDGRSGAGLTLTLDAGVRLEVEVLRGGEGLPGVEAQLSRGSLVLPAAAPTGRDGLAVFESVPPGAWTLALRIADGPPVSQRLDVSVARRVRIVIPPAVWVSGRVTDVDTSLPVAGARVLLALKASGGVFPMEALSDGDGRWRVAIPQGQATFLSVEAEGYATWPASRDLNKVLQRLRPLAKGQEVVLDAALARGARVEGRVTDADGAVIAGLALLSTDPRGRARTATTAEDGRYVLEHLNAGRHDLSVVTEGWYPEAALKVDVPREGASVTFDVRLLRARTLEGVVLHDAGTPAGGAYVWVTGGGDVLRSARNAGRPLETFSAEDGSWRLGDVPTDRGVFVRATLGPLEASPVPVPKGRQPVVGLRVPLAPTGTIRGRVQDLGSRGGVALAQVRVRPVGDPPARDGRNVVADSEGDYVVAGLVPGEWELLPSKGPAYLPAEAVRAKVTSEVREVDLDLRLDPGLALAGVVLDERNAGVAGATVRVEGTAEGGPAVKRNAPTDGRGEFRLTGFRSGTYRLVVRKEGYAAASLEGLRGGEERLRIVLQGSAPK